MIKIWLVEIRKKGSAIAVETHRIEGVKSHKTAVKRAKEEFIEKFPKGPKAGAKDVHGYEFKYVGQEKNKE